jgi:hypothetical protein
MNELKDLLNLLLSVMLPKEYDGATVAKCRPNVDPDTGKEYTYADITSQLASGTIFSFGAKTYTFEAKPLGTPYTDKGVSKTLQGNTYKLIHVKTIDNARLESVLG